MSDPPKTAIVTGASQGIGAGIVKAFIERGFYVVASSRKVTQSSEVAASDHVALVDGDIGDPATAARIVETALARFKSIDVLANNAGIFYTKPFTDYTAEDGVARRDEPRGLPCTSPSFRSSKCGSAEDRGQHRHDHGVPGYATPSGASRRQCR